MTLNVNIMAHKSRANFVCDLLDQLGDIPVVWDDGSNNRWKTGERCLQHHAESGADYGLTIQDDAIPCKDLLAGCEKLVQHLGDRPCGLYVGRVRPYQATVTPAVQRVLEAGSPWLEMDGPWWGVGIILPTKDIPALSRWATRSKIENYDRRISKWYEQRGVKCWYTVPSLVDHRPVAENPSLIAGRTGDRQAHTFLEGSALDVDWSRPAVSLEAALNVTFRHRQRGNAVTVLFGSAKWRALSRNVNWILEGDDCSPSLSTGHALSTSRQAA